MNAGEIAALIFFAFSAMALVFFVGYLVAERKTRQTAVATQSAAAPAVQPPATTAKPIAADPFEWTKAEHILRNFCDVTEDLNRDVTQHGSRIESFNVELRQANGSQDLLRHAITGIVQANEWLQGQLTSAQKTIHEQSAQLHHYIREANTDALTGLPNRRSFDRELERYWARWERYHRPFSVIVLDIDHFKKINDAHGHAAGDLVLEALARVIESTMRESDFAARYGGEEFVVLLPESDPFSACAAAERFRHSVHEEAIYWQGTRISVTISTGVCSVDNDKSTEALMERADRALYYSKSNGRNRTTVAGSDGPISSIEPEVARFKQAMAESA